MSEVKAPKIEFPCSYPIKVMGHATPQFEQDVLALVQKHAPKTKEEHVSVRPSNNGNYLAVTLIIEATGQEQLTVMFEDLKTHASVKLVL
ncbi:MAG: HP0495 family protein [Gammaproteobacteria bacterium]